MAMRSLVTSSFRKMMDNLPQDVQIQARTSFEMWKQNPSSVGWKKLTGTRANLFCTQIGRRYRAIGAVNPEGTAVVWMFIGSHETYNNWIDINRQRNTEHWLHAPDIKRRLMQHRDSQKTGKANDPSSPHLS